jgi:hypothetical protein
MGQLAVIDMVAQVQQGLVTLHDAVKWHLTANHYPSVDEVWVPTCVQIIKRYNDGDSDISYLLERPDRAGATWNAEHIIQRFHLEAFLDQ